MDELLQAEGRQPGDVRRSLMTGCVFGRDDAEVAGKLAPRGRTVDEERRLGVIAGTPSQIVDQLGRLAEVGVQRVMLQWLDLDDLDGLEAMDREVLPQLQVSSLKEPGGQNGR